MASQDRVLVRAQSTASENGIYVWNGASTAMTRSLDASTFAELEQAVTTVEEGTSAATTWRQDQINGTIGSSSISWVAFGTAAPAASESTAGIAELATQAETDTGTDDARNPGRTGQVQKTSAADVRVTGRHGLFSRWVIAACNCSRRCARGPSSSTSRGAPAAGITSNRPSR
jgi:hypothetical protein